jgi:hypothetical protein
MPRSPFFWAAGLMASAHCAEQGQYRARLDKRTDRPMTSAAYNVSKGYYRFGP